MLRRIRIATLAAVLAAGLPFLGPRERSVRAQPIENVEEQVHGKAARYNAGRQQPDISGDRIIWQDFRFLSRCWGC